MIITLAMRKPSEKSMISQICCKSGTIQTTGRNNALTDSGSSVRPSVSVKVKQAVVLFKYTRYTKQTNYNNENKKP